MVKLARRVLLLLLSNSCLVLRTF